MESLIFESYADTHAGSEIVKKIFSLQVVPQVVLVASILSPSNQTPQRKRKLAQIDIKMGGELFSVPDLKTTSDWMKYYRQHLNATSTSGVGIPPLTTDW